jgi:hypothetical protein
MHDHVERLGGPSKALPELQRRLGLENGYMLYKMQRLDVINKIPADYLPVMAEYFGEPPPGLDFWAPQPLPGLENGLAVQVEGTVAAEIFRTPTPPERTAIVERSAEWPQARHRAFEVGDDSMVDAGIPQGATIACVDFRDTKAPLDDGMAVVIERQQGKVSERRVAAVARFDNRVEFQPRSPNERHKPVVLSAGKKEDRAGIPTQVLAVVYAVISKPKVRR